MERRFRLASPVTAMVLAGLTLVLMAAGIALDALTGQLSVLSSGPIVPTVVIYAGVGVVVARRQPRNPIGWLLIIFILVLLLSTVVGSYAVLYYRFGHHGLPLAPVAVLLQPVWAPAILLFPVVILLFPDGRLASRRWRWMLLAYAVAGALASAAIFAPAVTAVAGHDVHLDAFGDVTSGGRSQHGLLGPAEFLGLLLILVAWLSFVGHQVLSWRRAVGERRQQLKWLASGAAVTVVVIAASFGISTTGAAGEVLGIGLAALPVGIGVGILKYRLYEIDRIISRAVSYAIVTGLLVGLYASLVLLATEVIRVKSPVAVAASTLIAAALFNPLRRRVQRAVDRRFNRARYDADEAVTAFAARLQDAVDLISVQDDLTGVVRRALEPTHVSVWLSPRG
jgi:hypothetical protein